MINHWGNSVSHSIAAHDGRYGAQSLLNEKVELWKDFPFSSYWQMGKALRSIPCDLVCSYNWGAMDALLANRLFAHRPWVHHDEGFGADEAVHTNPKRNLYRRLAYPGASRVVVVSRPLERIALKNWKQPQARLAYLPNGIALEPFAMKPPIDAIPEFERQPGEIVIGTVARLSEVKNLPLLVEAVSRLSARHKVRLVIVGEGPERGKIIETAKRLDCMNMLVLPGFLAEPNRYVGLFDVFALSSNTEQFPISLAEAMAAGLPCVATDVGDCREMLGAHSAGCIVPPGNAEQLAMALDRLCSDGALRATLGAANRAWVAEHYGWGRMMQRYAALYSEVSSKVFPA